MSINIVNPLEQAYVAIEDSTKKVNINYIENEKRINSFLKLIRVHRLFSHPVSKILVIYGKILGCTI